MAPMISSLKVFLVLQNSFQTIKYVRENALFIYIYFGFIRFKKCIIDAINNSENEKKKNR